MASKLGWANTFISGLIICLFFENAHIKNKDYIYMAWQFVVSVGVFL